MGKQKNENRIESLGLVSRAFGLTPDTFDETTRSIEGVLTTENRVKTFDWNRWDYVDEILLIDGFEYPEQIPLLDSHNRNSVKNQLGSIRNIRKESGRIIGRLFFSKTADAEEALVKAREGHLTDISIGYIPHNVYVEEGAEFTHTDGRKYTGPVNVSTRTEMKEGSLTPIGADVYAKLRSEEKIINENRSLNKGENDMNGEKERTEKPVVETQEKPVERKEDVVIDNTKEIIDLCEIAGTPERALAFIKENADIASVRTALLKKPETAPAQRAKVEVDQTDKTREIMSDVFVLRTLPAEKTGYDKSKIEEVRKSGYFNYRFSDFARVCLANSGVDTSRMDSRKVIDSVTKRSFAGHTSDDFAYALAGGVEKIAAKAFSMADVTWSQWCSIGDVSNYKATSIIDMSGISTVEEIKKGQPAKRATFTDSKETAQLIDVGSEFVIDNQALANDDLDILKVAMRLSMGMASKVNAMAVAQLASTMGDNKALFHTDHKNLGSTAAISDTTISELVTLLGLMKDAKGNVLRVRGKNFLVSATKYATALKYLNPSMLGLADTTANTSVFRGQFNVIMEPEIDNQIATTSYFLMADPLVNDTVMVLFKDGQREPELTEEVSTHGNPLGMSWRITLPVVAKAATWRSMAKNVGA